LPVGQSRLIMEPPKTDRGVLQWHGLGQSLEQSQRPANLHGRDLRDDASVHRNLAGFPL